MVVSTAAATFPAGFKLKIQIPQLLSFNSNELVVRYNSATLAGPQLSLNPA